MKLQNRSTKEIVEAVKNEDGTYEVEGKTVKAEDMGRKYMKPKEEEKVGDISDIIESTSGIGGDIGGLALALSKAQGEFVAVKKASAGHGYDYANIEDVLKASLPTTSKHELSVSQLNLTMVRGGIHYTGVRTYLMHSGGGHLYSEMFMPTEKSKMNSLVQIAGGLVTYLRRYGIQSILGLATTDNDGSDK